MLNGNPPFFYHGTPKKNLKNILKLGLRPDYSDSHNEWPYAVYLTDRPDVARGYCGHDAPCKPEDWVILQIPFSAINTSELMPDDYEFPDAWAGVPEEEREMFDDYDDNWANCTWEISLAVCNQVAYLTSIPPKVIKVYTPGKTATVVADPLVEERDIKFQELAYAQRGEPEEAMLRCQHHPLGAGIGPNALEHIGDLTHRMSEHFSSYNGQWGTVKEKVEKGLRWLTNEYGFEREMNGNMLNNYEARKTRLSGKSYDELKAEFFGLWDAYAEAHSQLRVFNYPQRIARDAAVALGKRNFSRCIFFLRQLDRMLEKGRESWIEEAGAYKPMKTAAQHTRRYDFANLPSFYDLFESGKPGCKYGIYDLLNDEGDWQPYEDEAEELAERMGVDLDEMEGGDKDQWIYKNIARNDLEARFNKLRDFFAKMSFPATAYRALDLKKLTELRTHAEGEKSKNKLVPWSEEVFGHSWAWDEKGASNYGSNFQGTSTYTYTFRGLIGAPTDVDWETTLQVNFLMPEEHEIRLIDGSSIEITGYKKPRANEWLPPEPAFKTVVASHKTPAMSTTTFPNMDSTDGEGSNAYALLPQFVEGMNNTPQIDTLLGGKPADAPQHPPASLKRAVLTKEQDDEFRELSRRYTTLTPEELERFSSLANKAEVEEYDDSPNYISGECYQYAIALVELTGFEPVEFWCEEGPIHAAVIHPSGKFLDAGGLVTLKQLEKRYGVKLHSDETDINHLYNCAFPQGEEIEDAKVVARKQLKRLGISMKVAYGERWFHGTSDYNAKNIIAMGELDPSGNGASNWDGALVSRDGAVYVTNDLEVAWEYARSIGDDDGQVVFEVAVPNPHSLIPDEDSVSSALKRGNIKGDYHTAAEVRSVWLKQYNDSLDEDQQEYQFNEAFKPYFEDMEEGWDERWPDAMFALVDLIVKTNPTLARNIIEASEVAAHMGPLKVIGTVDKQGNRKPLPNTDQLDLFPKVAISDYVTNDTDLYKKIMKRWKRWAHSKFYRDAMTVIGKLGGYDIQMVDEGPIFAIFDPVNQVVAGFLELESRQNSYVERGVAFLPEYRGQGLVYKLYVYLITKGFIPILVSDDRQSPGAKSIWKQLATTKGLFVYAWNTATGEMFSVDPEDLSAEDAIWESDYSEEQDLLKDELEDPDITPERHDAVIEELAYLGESRRQATNLLLVATGSAHNAKVLSMESKPTTLVKPKAAADKKSYGVVMVDMPKGITNTFEIDEADLDGDGREDEPHITVRYGIEAGQDLEDIKELLSKTEPFTVTLGKTGSFPPSTYSDGASVVIVHVESPALHKLNEALGKVGKWKKSDFDEYKAHMTVAYVKEGTESKYVGLDTLEGIEHEVTELVISDSEENRHVVKFSRRKTAGISNVLPDFQQFVQQEGGFKNLFNSIADPSSDMDRYEPYTAEEEKEYMALDMAGRDQWLYDKAYEDWWERYYEILRTHESWTWPLKVYRTMTLKDMRSLKTKGVGIYWAYEEDAAQAHWGTFNGQKEYTLEGLITEDAVNWKNTMYNNLSPALGEDEKEIQLNKGARVQILRWKDESGVWRPASKAWKNVTAGAGDRNAYIPRTNTETPGLHTDPLFPEEMEPKVAYYNNDILWLKSYLTMSDAEKGEELSRTFTPTFTEYIENNFPEVWETVKDRVEDGYLDSPEGIPSEVFAGFYKDDSDQFMQMDPAECPSFMHMDYEGIVKNQWLIHKTDDADGICRSGFTYGMSDLSKLGLTTWFKNEGMDKKEGGYNFAFLTRDAAAAEGKYGSEAIIFRASGLMVYHYGDEETQVIFRGSEAHDIIPVYKQDGQWALSTDNRGTPAFQADSLSDIVEWIRTHYSQYRKVIVKRASFEQ